MRKKQKIVLIFGLVLMSAMLACSSSRSESLNKNLIEDSSNSAANKSLAESSPKTPPEDCPKATLSVNEMKNKALEKYEGCTVSVRGKIWEIDSSQTIALIDVTDRTGYSDKINVGGDFSDDAYYEIGRKLSDLKLNSEFEKLPVATFTGTVDGDAWLQNCILTDVEK